MKTAFLLGRALFGGFFFYSGINHFKQFRQMSGYASSKNVPAPQAAVLASGAMLTVGGLSVLLGSKPKYGTLLIAGFLAGASPMMHDFWNAEDPQHKQSEMVNFTKNVALLGASLALLAHEEPWEASVPLAEGAGERVTRLLRRAA
jgi:uncharacterized membrane protein YphA (DoxX/SURF4 family)